MVSQLWKSANEETTRDSYMFPEQHGLYRRNGGYELHSGAARENFLRPTEGNFSTLEHPETRKLEMWQTESQRYGKPVGSASEHNYCTLERAHNETWLKTHQQFRLPETRFIGTWAPGKD
uniref:Uncharacterized protein n=1 Tax=Polyblepharides amylifera TaxID=1486889 RepID=A0A7R9XND9_9CHLO|mmetsp:Transcript_460/g.643  ORF Transcript_460/g.643 Transcript_460/m.643 type:complete len:120 (+) Transcript_460:93-452(+)